MHTFRILTLHGFHSSSRKLSKQTANLRKKLAVSQDGWNAEFIFVDSRFETEPPAEDKEQQRYKWFTAVATETGLPSYDTWQESKSHLIEALIKHAPIDGILGFSQGAGMALILLGTERHGLTASENDVLDRIRFLWLSGGFLPMASNLTLTTGEDTPLRRVKPLIVHGMNDNIVTWERCEPMLSILRDPTIYRPENVGHVIPSRAADIQVYKEFLSNLASTEVYGDAKSHL